MQKKTKHMNDTQDCQQPVAEYAPRMGLLVFKTAATRAAAAKHCLQTQTIFDFIVPLYVKEL